MTIVGGRMNPKFTMNHTAQKENFYLEVIFIIIIIILLIKEFTYYIRNKKV